MKRSARGAGVLRYVGLALAGLVHALCFAPGPLPVWALAPLALLSLAVLAHQSASAGTVRQAMLRGWVFGFAMCCLGIHWIYISLHTYGFMAAPLAAAGVAALAVYMAIYPALACGLARYLAGRGHRLPLRAGEPPAARPRYPRALTLALTWAASWTAFEWLRGVIMTGFPWLNIGYAQVDGPLAGWAPVAGIYGIGLAAAFIAASLAGIARARLPLSAPDASGVAPRATERTATVALVLAAVIALAGVGLARVEWSHPTGAPLNVRLVQGNVEQSQKFDPAQMERGQIQHMNLASQPPSGGVAAPKLIVLPETIIPVFQNQVSPQVWQLWLRIAAERSATIIMGVPIHRRDASGDRYTNSVIGLDAQTPLARLMDGDPAMRYDKRHLVPFGEYVPNGFRWFVDAMSIPLGDFDRGAPRQTPFPVADQHVALDVCYEDLFGEELLPALAAGADGSPGATILANVSNLGWFGRSWALPQHLNIARMRTLETARPMLAATNTGMTAAIDHKGHVFAQLPTHQANVLEVTVQGMAGLTPYGRMGDKPALALAGLLLVAAFARRLRARE